jgi:hypothetical protein
LGSKVFGAFVFWEQAHELLQFLDFLFWFPGKGRLSVFLFGFCRKIRGHAALI